MDLERIKQNFRLRSGRNKKPPKKSKSQKAPIEEQKPSAQPSQPTTTETASRNGHAVGSPALNGAPQHNTQPDLKEEEQTTGKTVQRQDSGVGHSPATPEERPTSFHTAKDYDLDIVEKQAEDTPESAAPSSEVQNEVVAEETASRTPVRAMSDPDLTSSETDDFDLRPPAPRAKPPSMESMSELLFSADHLHFLIYRSAFLTKFTAFLQKYRPQDHPLLTRYLETSKAIKAIEYANAVAESAPALAEAIEGNETETPAAAAVLNTSFSESCSAAFDTLVNISLPLYITYGLIRTISDSLIDEITGRTAPVMQNMMGGLSEVFCLTDPNQEDNPIIYSSEEFYRLTGYGQDEVIGHNCRFLQGPKTSRHSPQRLRESLARGEEIYETLLNYRRDGRPFINLLMIAPLHDGKGKVKYHLGAQIDVSRLIETGRVLDGFQKFLEKRDVDKKRTEKENAQDGGSGKSKKRNALNKLRELSELFDLEESTVVQVSSRSTSLERDEDVRSIGSGNARRRFVDSDVSEDEYDHGSTAEKKDWQLGEGGPSGMSGKLPGVYEKYMLIRPAPSLRVVFVSPKLRKFGSVVQSPFMSHVAAPDSTLNGLNESFKTGVPVSAKINFMPERTEERHGTKIPSNQKHEDGKYGRACWMSATPLLGGDGRIGVWIIIFVEKAQEKAQRARSRQMQRVVLQSKEPLNSSQKERRDQVSEFREPGPPGTNQKPTGEDKNYDMPIKPKRLDAVQTSSQRKDNQPSAANDQYQVATPVEEYRSADEESGSASPITPAPRADMPPQTPKYEQSEEESSTQPNSMSSTNSPLRLSHRVSSNHQTPERSSGKPLLRTRLDLTSNADDEDEDEDEYEEEDGSLAEDPNNIPPSVPSDRESLPAGEEEQPVGATTPATSMSHDKDHNFGMDSVETLRQHKASTPASPPQSPSASSPQAQSRPTSSMMQQSTRNSGSLPAGMGYMDYLRHPGSRNAPEEFTRGRIKSRDGKHLSDPWNEADCAQSPYSVD